MADSNEEQKPPVDPTPPKKEEPDDEELLRLKKIEEERKRIEAIWAAVDVMLAETPTDKLEAFLKQMREYKERFEEEYTSKVVKLVWRHRVGGYAFPAHPFMNQTQEIHLE